MLRVGGEHHIVRLSKPLVAICKSVPTVRRTQETVDDPSKWKTA